MQAGMSFELENDERVLSIDTPRAHVTGGPFRVVWKDIEERWAIVAFEWDTFPRLGIRWFYGTSGFPTVHGHSIWLALPNNLCNSILNGLPLDKKFRSNIDDFLEGKLSGSDL